jgi:hypothetical protein
MHPQVEERISEWQDRVDVPVGMQRPMGVVFGGLALVFALVLTGIIAVMFVTVKRGLNLHTWYFASFISVLVVACFYFGRISLRLLRKRENEVGRASGRSLPSGPFFIYSFGILTVGLLLAVRFLTGPAFYVTVAILSSILSNLLIGSRRECPTTNPSMDRVH